MWRVTQAAGCHHARVSFPSPAALKWCSGSYIRTNPTGLSQGRRFSDSCIVTSPTGLEQHVVTVRAFCAGEPQDCFNDAQAELLHRLGGQVHAMVLFTHGYQNASRIVPTHVPVPLIGCTVESFIYNHYRGRPFLSLTGLCLPDGVTLEPWSTSSAAIPPLHDYPGLVRAGNTSFVILSDPPKGFSATRELLQRLSSLFPDGRCVAGMATGVRRGSSVVAAEVFMRLPPRADNAPAAAGSESVATPTASPPSTVGLALHGLRDDTFMRHLVVSAFGDVEFDGSHGVLLDDKAAAALVAPQIPAGGLRWPATTFTPHIAAQPAAKAPAVTTPSPLAVEAASLTRDTGSTTASTQPEPLLHLSSPMPMFITDSPVFPEQYAVFRIFEPRYRLMLKMHLERGTPFCVGLPPARVDDSYSATDEEEEGGVQQQPGQAGARAATTQEGTLLQSVPPSMWNVPSALPECHSQTPRSAMTAAVELHSQLYPPVDTLRSIMDASNPADVPNNQPGDGPPPQTPTWSSRQGTAAGPSLTPAVIMRVDDVRAVPGALDGCLLVKLQAVSRVAIASAWVAQGTFGLVHVAACELRDAAVHEADARWMADLEVALADQLKALCFREAAGADARHIARVQAMLGVDTPNLPALRQLSPERLSWWLANALSAPGSVKQSYLASRSVADRLRRQLRLLSSIMESAATTKASGGHQTVSASG